MNRNGAAGIRKRRLGRTDIEITPIGLGTWQFAGGQGFDRFVWQDVSDDATNAIVKAALDGGINWFDTAEAYGMGRSEQRLSSALQAAGAADEDVLIATKWMPVFRTAGSLGRTIVKRRRVLKPYSIGLYQIHQAIAFSTVTAQMDAMAELVDLGLVRSVGVSNFPARFIRKAYAALSAHHLPLASNQIKVSLLDRHIETSGVLNAARELGMTIISWSPLEMGVLTGKFHKDPELLKTRPAGRRAYMQRQMYRSSDLIAALEDIAAANGVTPAVVALSWTVNFYGDTVVAIPGASKVNQVEQNLMANELKLTEKEMAHLDRLSSRFRRMLPLGR
jgi:aryl-alcohol dehydrogenase-like predicted oxidoreductase